MNNEGLHTFPPSSPYLVFPSAIDHFASLTSLTELGLAAKWEKTEYVEKIEFFKELSAQIFPEIDYNSFPAAKGLIFSIQ
jgi:hypothetical protein